MGMMMAMTLMMVGMVRRAGQCYCDTNAAARAAAVVVAAAEEVAEEALAACHDCRWWSPRDRTGRYMRGAKGLVLMRLMLLFFPTTVNSAMLLVR